MGIFTRTQFLKILIYGLVVGIFSSVLIISNGCNSISSPKKPNILIIVADCFFTALFYFVMR